MNDDGWLMVAARCALVAERRFDRAYDSQSPATLRHPNGSLVMSFDRAFCGAAGRELLALSEEETA